MLANWRWVFFITGAVGLIWTMVWRMNYFPPDQHPQLSGSEREELHSVLASSTGPEPTVRWLDLLRFREVWGIVIAKFLSDAAWYFYLFWLPKYLYDARGFDIKAVGAFAWIPYAASGIGCLFGGGLSSWLLRRHHSLNFSRKALLGTIAGVMPSILFVPHVPVAGAIALFSVAYFGHQFWSTLVMILPADLFPKRAVGSVAGLVGFGGAMGGVAFGQLVGYLLDHGFGYSPVFFLAATFHVIAFLTICLSVPVILPLKIDRG